MCLFRCLNQCTYCKTKHARGELGSYPPEEIVARAKQAFQGNKEELEIIFLIQVLNPLYCTFQRVLLKFG
jgi:tRNA A37 methylthiotransferase MiaB